MGRSTAAGGGLAALALLVAAGPAAAQALTQDEALRVAFPLPAAVERRTGYLSEAQQDSVRLLAGGGEVSGVVTYYVGRRDGQAVGVAYFDAHRVRTLQEVLMIVVGPDDRIARIEVLRFQEPPDYQPAAGWLRQFTGAGLTDGLSLKGDIAGMSGATLTSRAVVLAARRILALHRVLHPLAGTAP